jgi:hypothetical protein
MNSGVAAVFGAVIAVILLALFSWSTFYMVTVAVGFCATTKPCVAPIGGLMGEGFVYVVTTVGGLVSALVIAQLSVTPPGKVPTVGSFAPETERSATAVTIVVALYLLAWIATGLTALVVGVMLYPKVIQTLSDIGTTWLGLAVSAAYAYFGLSPSSNRADDRARDEGLGDEPFRAPLSDDLTRGQKVPNRSEKSASGPIRKKIRRTDPEFASLVSNTNPKITFKDEEGTGADRMMTSRLSEKLNNLADLVAAEWPGTKLRVTEAWDENDEHSPTALHYEGRAADLTTDPVSGAKLGRLARLAVHAGLDWVFFEDSRHIHVSVKA